jgi:hypothetical protein
MKLEGGNAYEGACQVLLSKVSLLLVMQWFYKTPT